MTQSTSVRVRRYNVAKVTAERLATLRSMLRKYPSLRLERHPVAFGVSLVGNAYLDTWSTQDYTRKDLIDWLECFIELLDEAPEELRRPFPPLDG